jgi:hypothetical protein
MLEKIYEIYETRMLYLAEIWGIEDGWEIVEGVLGKFYKIVIRISKNDFYLIFNKCLIIGA